MTGASGCSEDPLDGLGNAPGLPGTEGRSRYVVTFDKPAPDLAEYRAVLSSNPGGAASYAAKKRQEAAAAMSAVEEAVKASGGVVVEIWWMSNQATIEMPQGGLGTIRAVSGVKSVEPDRALQ